MNIYHYRRLKNVNRLNTEPITRPYNLLEHSYMVTILFCHFAKLEHIEYDAVVLEAILHHDILETITGDLPWNVKNHNANTQSSWINIEEEAVKMKDQFEPYTDQNLENVMDTPQYTLFKTCDMLDLWIFLQEERRLGNMSLACFEIMERAKKLIYGKFRSIDDYMVYDYTF